VHDLARNTISLIDGKRADAATAGDKSNFTAPLSDAKRQQFNAAYPNRLAVEHTHSQHNPEKDWGRDTLRAIEFAFYVLNEQFGTPGPHGEKMRTITKHNTVVIASSISNGAAAALAAAEQDEHGLIDGVAVTEPNIQVAARHDLIVKRGALNYSGGSKPLLDYSTFANLYQPCAALSTRAATSALPFSAAFVPFAQARCASLGDKGLLSTTTPAAQGEEALDKLLAYGWEPGTIPLHVSHWSLATPGIAMTYSNAHGRFSVADNLCSFSFAYTDAAGNVIAPLPTLATIFGAANGVPPPGGINIVNNNNPAAFGGPKFDRISASPSNNKFDFNLDGALCQRDLVTGRGENAARVQVGMQQAQRRGDRNLKPTIIVHGRDDALVPVNFSSRPYYAQHQRVRGHKSEMVYIEVTNAQHFDALLGVPGYAENYVPLHVYFNRALDAMYAHLTAGAALPPSQIVRTTPRGAVTMPIGASNVPSWLPTPPAAERIVFDGNMLTIPD